MSKHNNDLTDMSTVVSGLSTDISNLKSRYIVEGKTSPAQSIGNGSRGIFSWNIQKTGYTPKGVVGVSLSNGYMFLSAFSCDTTNGNAIVQNKTGSADSSVKVTLYILYEKNM